MVLLPLRERRLRQRRARGDPGRADEHVEAAVLEDDPPDDVRDRLLARHVDPQAERAPRAEARAELLGDRLRALRVEVGDGDVGAELGELRAVARPIPLAPPVTSAIRPESSLGGGSCASL